MLRRLYNGVLGLAGGRFALPALAAMAFTDGSFFPMPPDLLLGPMVLAKPQRSWLYAAVTTLSSILGGCVGYAIGFFLTPLGFKLLALTGHGDYLAKFQAWFHAFGLWLILIKGFIPIPYQLVAISAGLAHFPFAIFVSASLVTRGARFFLEAYLLRHPGAKAFIDEHLAVLTIAGVLVLGLAFVLMKHLG